MRASTKRILSILLSALFLIGVVVVSVTLIKPSVEKILKDKRKLFSKRNLYKTQKKAVEDVQGVINRFESFKKARTGVNLALPLKKNSTEIIRQVNAIARTSGVNLRSFSSQNMPFEETDRPLTRRLGSIEVNVSIEGGYSQTKKFIDLLESNVRIFNIKSMQLASDESGRKFNSNIVFKAYFQE
ncbi:MAG: type 4a pilus biogenesis protein PilO [Candidatus Magasanikbacteria bacterium]